MEPITPLQAPPAGPPLYSSRAVRVFSILFSAIVGGILVAQNLKDIGEPELARKALWGSILYTILLNIAMAYLPGNFGGSIIPLLVGLVGGLGLSIFFERHISNWAKLPAKSTTKPLLICLAIFTPLAILLISVMLNAPAE